MCESQQFIEISEVREQNVVLEKSSLYIDDQQRKSQERSKKLKKLAKSLRSQVLIMDDESFLIKM
jgi:hypothetical protein